MGRAKNEREEHVDGALVNGNSSCREGEQEDREADAILVTVALRED